MGKGRRGAHTTKRKAVSVKKTKTPAAGGPSRRKRSGGAGAALRAGGPAPGVRVRMYRQGLGDCLLLTFTIAGAEKHILIDCGSLGATTTKMTTEQLVSEIRTATKGHLDLLVVTHEHQDHVSKIEALVKETAKQKKLVIDRVWLAWTEDPEDDLAKELAKTKSDLGLALGAAVDYLRRPGMAPGSEEIAAAAEGVLGFSAGVDETMDFVRTGLGVPATIRQPGDVPRTKDWLPGFRIFVLGPPKSRAALYDEGGHDSAELYGISRALDASIRFLESGLPFDKYAIDPANVAKRADFDAQSPFDSRFRYEEMSPRVGDVTSDYLDPKNAWRRIDVDWLRVVPELALQLDGATNNTSLVLAIERIADGKVLLFPADAQQGNWLSWHDEKFAWKPDDPDEPIQHVTVPDLLRRTVFYKVGHHGSHNATARDRGLELMESPELTAFIPVDRDVALGRHPKGSWRMPARPLYRRLLEKCSGRVVRSDIGFAAQSSASKKSDTEFEFVGIATTSEWKTWKSAQNAAVHVKVEARYVDFILEPIS